jgi:hypothetical protein
MKGVLFTKDGLSQEILVRALRDDGFDSLAMRSPDVANFRDLASDDPDLLILIDLDFVNANDVRLFLPELYGQAA